MTSERDIERVLDHWFTERPTQVADHVLDEVADRIARQPQQPAWRVSRRDTHVNSYLKPLLAVAAVVLIAVVGYSLLPREQGVGGPAPTPSPAPTRTPSATPVVQDLPEGAVAAGTYKTTPLGSLPGLTATFTVPDGWQGFQKWAILGPNGTEAPTGIGVGFLRADGLFGDPCHWDVDGTGSPGQPGDVEVGPTVDDLVAALQANGSYTTSTPVPVMVDGYAGQRIDVHVPAGLDLTSCDKDAETAHYYLLGGAEGGLYAQGPGQIFHDWILDVDGDRVIVGYNDYETTPAADRAAAEAIIDSMSFGP
jgi:hypothetical protein